MLGLTDKKQGSMHANVSNETVTQWTCTSSMLHTWWTSTQNFNIWYSGLDSINVRLLAG